MIWRLLEFCMGSLCYQQKLLRMGVVSPNQSEVHSVHQVLDQCWWQCTQVPRHHFHSHMGQESYRHQTLDHLLHSLVAVVTVQNLEL